MATVIAMSMCIHTANLGNITSSTDLILLSFYTQTTKTFI